MFREIPNNIKILKLFILLSFIVCWMSVSTSFNDILIFFDSDPLNLNKLINFFRHLSVYICLFFLILIFLIFNKKINFKKYIIFYFLIGYFASQVLGLFISNNEVRVYSSHYISFSKSTSKPSGNYWKSSEYTTTNSNIIITPPARHKYTIDRSSLILKRNGFTLYPCEVYEKINLTIINNDFNLYIENIEKLIRSQQKI